MTLQVNCPESTGYQIRNMIFPRRFSLFASLINEKETLRGLQIVEKPCTFSKYRVSHISNGHFKRGNGGLPPV
ncbi:hypothetical protein ACOZB4_24570, partial [Paenibacillus sp. NPDC058898]|uniref:hypothetical protein n=1 Tax=Paenibacillus sp. NPDC058898 TaxID=3346669 RepID=UPI003BF4B5C5